MGRPRSIISYVSSSDAKSISSSYSGMSSSDSFKSSRSGASAMSQASDTRSMASFTSGMSNFTDIMATKLYRELQDSHWLRRMLFDVVQHVHFNNFILAIIMVNTVIMALQTVDSINKPYGYHFAVVDSVFLGIYIIECVLKIFVFHWNYFKSGWNKFDFFIVLTSILTWIIPVLIENAMTFNIKIFRLFRVFRAVRALRSLRVLRTISFLRSLQMIVSTLLKSIPAMANILALTGLVLYIFAVIARSTYGDIDPRRFGNLGSCFFRLFQLMTLDNWSNIYMDNKDKSPEIWAFLAIFIIIETFVFLNLFIAVIVNNLQQLNEKAAAERRKRSKKKSSEDDEQDDNGGYNNLQLEGEGDGAVQDSDELRWALEEVFAETLDLNAFYDPNLLLRKKELYAKYFQLLASLEHNMNSYQKQQKVLDDLVDLVKEHAEKQQEFNPDRI